MPADLLPAWKSVIDQALELARHCFARAGDYSRLRLHGECHAGNVLWTEGTQTSGPHFVDFDDSRMGPAVQDLWMLLSGDRDNQVRQLADILAGYRTQAAAAWPDFYSQLQPAVQVCVSVCLGVCRCPLTGGGLVVAGGPRAAIWHYGVKNCKKYIFISQETPPR